MSRAALFLLIVGLLQMTGDLLRLPALKAVAAATGASPAPKVFSSVQGLETFSSTFYLEWRDRDGVAHTVELTPELYSRVRGPYNRRNVFGAALAYAPILSADPRTRNQCMKLSSNMPFAPARRFCANSELILRVSQNLRTFAC